MWRRAGTVGWRAAKGGWRLHRAGTGTTTVVEAPATLDGEAHARVTPKQAVLLGRYVACRFVLGWLELFFLLKYLLLIGGVALLLVDEWVAVGIALVVVFVIAAGLQWLVSRVIRRLGAIDRLAGLDDILATGAVAWWPNLKRELARAGLKPHPWRLMGVAGRIATGRLSEREREALCQVDWSAVLPRQEWLRARQVLARATEAPRL